MRKALLVATVSVLVAAGVASGYSRLRTIWITPGHCVTVGKTKVCARKAPKKTPPAKSSSGKAQDKGFVVQSLQVKDDGIGDIGGIARLTNTTKSTHTISFTFTFFRSNGTVVGTAVGTANQVAPGETVTATLVSQDPISALPSTFKYQFQVDAEF